MTDVRLTRRQRQRAQTVVDIKDEALRQLSAGSLETVTLSAIARALDMSVAGLYRYFASRDELLVALAEDSYRDFADALHTATQGSHGGQQLERVVDAYRSWALTHPGRYRLMFSSTWGAVRHSPHIAHADRAMATMLHAVIAAREAFAFSKPSPSLPPMETAIDPKLAEQLRAWAERTGLPAVSPDTLWHSVTTWTRLHGIVSLEIEGAWAAMGLQPTLLIATEMTQLDTGNTTPHDNRCPRASSPPTH